MVMLTLEFQGTRPMPRRSLFGAVPNRMPVRVWAAVRAAAMRDPPPMAPDVMDPDMSMARRYPAGKLALKNMSMSVSRVGRKNDRPPANAAASSADDRRDLTR